MIFWWEILMSISALYLTQRQQLSMISQTVYGWRKEYYSLQTSAKHTLDLILQLSSHSWQGEFLPHNCAVHFTLHYGKLLSTCCIIVYCLINLDYIKWACPSCIFCQFPLEAFVLRWSSFSSGIKVNYLTTTGVSHFTTWWQHEEQRPDASTGTLLSTRNTV